VQVILLSVVVSIAILVMAYIQQRKNSAAIDEITSNNNFQVYDYAKKRFIIVIAFGILAIVASFFAFEEGKELGVALSIVLITSVIGEPIINYKNLRFYYNETSCILEGKHVRYRSIKEFRPKAFNILKQQEVITLSGEKFRVEKSVADIIKDEMSKKKK